MEHIICEGLGVSERSPDAAQRNPGKHPFF